MNSEQMIDLLTKVAGEAPKPLEFAAQLHLLATHRQASKGYQSIQVEVVAEESQLKIRSGRPAQQEQWVLNAVNIQQSTPTDAATVALYRTVRSHIESHLNQVAFATELMDEPDMPNIGFHAPAANFAVSVDGARKPQREVLLTIDRLEVEP